MAAKQNLLETASLRDRINMVLEHLTLDLQMLELKNQIQTKVRVDLDKQQRDYFLKPATENHTGRTGRHFPDLEIENLRQRALKKKWSKEVKTQFAKELEKLTRTNPAAADYSVQINYLELLLDLPWNEFTKDNFDLKRAQKVLDKDHLDWIR
jgi:ATP-dependent Lon protease